MGEGSVTFYSYPIDAHKQWALDQAEYDPKLIEDASIIPQHTEVGVVQPKTSAFDTLFELDRKNPSWATFAPPPGFISQSNRFFSMNVVPNIVPDTVVSRFLKELEKILLGKKSGSFEQINRIKEMLITLLECMDYLNHLLLDIRARISQYQKG